MLRSMSRASLLLLPLLLTVACAVRLPPTPDVQVQVESLVRSELPGGSLRVLHVATTRGREKIVVQGGGNDLLELPVFVYLFEHPTEGPVLIEAVTYRIKGHYVGDPEATYRDPKDVEAAREKEPLKRAKEKLLEAGVDEAELDAMQEAVVAKLARLETWALEQEFPTLEAAVDHVGIALENAPEVRGPQSLVL